ncbi:MAG TPA: efflux RND transporter periplasmic adaptor subunit [Caulobacteraceae bacterium]
MRRIPIWAWAAAGVAVVAVLLFVLLHKQAGGDAADAETQPTAAVTTATVRAETLATVVRAYGVIQPAADAVVTLSAPRAAVITGLLAGMGQQVRAGQPLLRIANAPATQQSYRQATDAVIFAETDLARLQRLAGEHLATNDQVGIAQKTLADARATLAAQQAEGASHTFQTLAAPSAAVVTSVTVKTGDRVAQDAPLLTLARSGSLVASLNVQPGVGGVVAAGDAATVSSAFGGAPLALRLGSVGRLADSTTRAIQAVAAVPAGAFPVGEAVQADIVTGTHPGLVVPRAAVIFDETGAHIFTIVGAKAHRVFVKVGAEHGVDIEISGPIADGAMIAVQGAYELQDGMGVRTAP